MERISFNLQNRVTLNGVTFVEMIEGPAQKRIVKPHAAKKWSSDDNSTLIAMLNQKRSLKEIAVILGRTEGAVMLHARQFNSPNKVKENE